MNEVMHRLQLVDPLCILLQDSAKKGLPAPMQQK
jgi:hypothetical protein